MKNTIRLTLSLAVLLLTTGCWDRMELNDLSIITAIAFDKPDNDPIKVTVQILIPKIKGGGGIGASTGGAAHQTTIRSETGLDIADALSKLQLKIPRSIFWGQCKVFIFGEEVAKEGIIEHFDFLIRHPQPRERGYMFVSKGEASELLDLFPPIERSSSEVLRELMKKELSMSVTMEELSIMLKEGSRDAALPLVHILPKAKSSKERETIPYVSGAAIFKDGKMVGNISKEETRGVLWLRNEMQQHTVTVENEIEKGVVSINARKSKVRLVPAIEGGTWKMTVKVNTEGDIVQNGTRVNPMNRKLLKKLEAGFREAVSERIEEALEKIQREQKADVVGFGTAYHRKYPKHWAKAKDNWDETFSEVKVKIEVHAQIIRPGLLNSPGGIPADKALNK
ncbi:Ger(x)C family spore germination protein [Cohnella faecalis]|uniref:Ger(X)C family spore germination protein n=1 Tax=Cohnella faecalis TaxID=2315694 RepID=A0A398CKH3_9BACL|nr:Ger(x)C family spore germination protein [Cohnella faecalis]RIE02652.1 Ger(x)C family spore germination protein [Cohnella faecalis]